MQLLKHSFGSKKSATVAQAMKNPLAIVSEEKYASPDFNWNVPSRILSASSRLLKLFVLMGGISCVGYILMFVLTQYSKSDSKPLFGLLISGPMWFAFFKISYLAQSGRWGRWPAAIFLPDRLLGRGLVLRRTAKYENIIGVGRLQESRRGAYVISTTQEPIAMVFSENIEQPELFQARMLELAGKVNEPLATGVCKFASRISVGLLTLALAFVCGVCAYADWSIYSSLTDHVCKAAALLVFLAGAFLLSRVVVRAHYDQGGITLETLLGEKRFTWQGLIKIESAYDGGLDLLRLGSREESKLFLFNWRKASDKRFLSFLLDPNRKLT